jgi:glycosyltransferase involved in cell wall biosynthesis
MKILLQSHVLDDPDAGASRVYHLLADEMRSRGHLVTLRHLDDVQLPSDPRLSLLLRRVALPHLVSRCAGAADPMAHDVVMASSGMAYPLFRRLRGVTGRPALVNHLHGLHRHDHVAGMSEHHLGHVRAGMANRLVTGPVQSRWDLAGVASADATVVQNLRDLGDVRSLAAGSTVIMIPPALHPELLSATPVGRPASGARLLWFATWEARKGCAYVPGLLRHVRQQRPDATLTIAGTGRAAESIISQFHPEDRGSVTVLPRLTRAEQGDLLASATVFVFPSLSEGFGLALLEALAAGVPAVTTATGLGGDFLRDGVHARVVPATVEHMGRAVVELLDDPEARTMIGSRARELARTFTIERMADAYDDVFSSLTCARASSR